MLFITVSVASSSGYIFKGNKSLLIQKQTASLDDFDQKITFLMRLGHMPSLSACIINNDSIIWSKGYGLSDRRNNKQATEHTIYMAGSITKTFIATALLQLYEQGFFSLDDDVNMYLPFELRNPHYPDEPITMRMLLSHQSSLGEPLRFIFHFFFINYSYEWLDDYLIPGGSMYHPDVWNKYPPGESFHYANIGFELLGYILQRLSNQSVEDYCEEHIFTPLEMKNTSFHVSDFEVDELAVPYIRRGGWYIPLPHYDIGCTAAGGIRTSVMDLSHFLLAHMNEGVYKGTRILEKETIELMHTIQYPESSQYGLGWILDTSNDDIYGGHTGGVFGGSAFMFYRDSDNVGVIFFININRVITLRLHLLEQLSWIGIQQHLFEKGTEIL
jgi:CubicO group peptidase (beta-lactamase class C family)